jgi:plasmid stabilization system protein ParE
MNLDLVVEPAAEQDILQAYRWYEDRRVGLGPEFLAELELAFDRTLENPLLYVEAIPGVRRSVTKTFPYLVFYVFDRGTVYILAVIHAAQNPTYIAGRVGEQKAL